jgi:hypothetical protein
MKKNIFLLLLIQVILFQNLAHASSGGMYMMLELFFVGLLLFISAILYFYLGKKNYYFPVTLISTIAFFSIKSFLGDKGVLVLSMGDLGFNMGKIQIYYAISFVLWLLFVGLIYRFQKKKQAMSLRE